MTRKMAELALPEDLVCTALNQQQNNGKDNNNE